jgi:glutamate dehydrogenase/leucine dehydrogenase
MPSTIDAVNRFLDAKILYGPGKAANAGGVATSGLEMSQNSMRLSWSREEVDQRLHGIMKSIHKACWETSERFGTPGNYVNGANIGGYLKVADAMMDQGVVYTAIDPKLDHNPLWNHTAHCAFPSATQNEINGKDAMHLISNGVYVVSEGANMPTTIDGVNAFLQAKILYGPGKAANAGGVATSGLEMSQNSLRLSWTREEVDQRLHGIMKSIHKAAYETSIEYGTPGNYVNGANIAGFLKVADSMMDQGLV